MVRPAPFRLSLPLVAGLAALLIVFVSASTTGLRDRTAWTGLAAVLSMLAIYAGASFWAWTRSTNALVVGGPLGLVAGAVYATEIALEYILTPNDNTAFGLLEFGAVFGLLVVAGAMGAWRNQRFVTGVSAAVWTAVISAVIWYAVLIGAFILFRGSERQALVLRAEGDFEDFRRSGAASFEQFIVQDFFGAGFYHLLLAPVVAGLFGSLGSGVALIALGAVKKRRPV